MTHELLPAAPRAAQPAQPPLPALPAQARWTKRISLGTRTRNARAAAGMSRTDLADGLTSVAYLSRIEADERRPGPVLLAQLAGRLGVDPADLVGTAPRGGDGLRRELTHADLLLASGHLAGAQQVSADLAEVATAVGSTEVASAARVVGARALTARGECTAALRALRPLRAGTAGLLAQVAAARAHLELAQFHDAILVGHRVTDQIGGAARLSLPETADLAVTVCAAYQAIGRPQAADRAARLALRHLADRCDGTSLDPQATGAAPVPFGSFDQVVRRTEHAVATLQLNQLRADVAELRESVCDLPDWQVSEGKDAGHA
ncbi:helix-turn-helix domain-containing protein [Marmoricola sp. RAF53]|uniref:helix-turn-helix domain-containing protein n=1 Tax=Marmoricola sp. RAF53 TaxID=3233059 RepID=UPI003F9897DD